MDTSLFGLRFESNAELHPDPADLAAFLRSPRAPGEKGLRQDDLAVFTGYMDRVEKYEKGSAHGVASGDASERMLLGVLSQTQFFRPSFRLAIEEYLYHHHQLLALDFTKPEKFVRSAEEELSRLNSKKKDDQQKIARLQVLIEQRKKDLESLAKRRHLIASELCLIAAYVRDNVEKVLQRCEGAITSLAKLQVDGTRAEQLIDDLKAHFKEEVRERRHMGTVTPEYLESLKTEVAQLSQRLARLMLGDVHAVTGVYDGFHEHAKKHAALLNDLIARAQPARKVDAYRVNRPFAELESALVALVSEFRPAVKAAAPEGVGERHGDLLEKLRREMLDHIFTLLKSGTGRDTGTTR